MIKVKAMLIVLLLFLMQASQAQSVSSQVQKISRAFGLINASKLEIKSFAYRNNCGVLKGTLNLYRENGQIKKVTDIGIGDDDKAAASWRYEYYYQNGSLIFSYQRVSYFDQEKNRHFTDETRTYFVANRAIKMIENKKVTYPRNITINQQDIRYRLLHVKKQTDVAVLYKCSQ